MKSNFTDSVSTSFRPTGLRTLYLLVLLTIACGWVQAQSFTDVSSLIPDLPQVEHGSVAWADYDGDGKPDFLITGTSEGVPVSKLYRNTGNGFEDVTSQVPGLPQVDHGSVAWADYDGDEKPDFLITGKSTVGSISKLYRNTGSSFMDVTTTQVPGLPG